MKKVKKAVIPAAGFGTRFLPITKSVCKEMLPIVDKPTLLYIVEEAVASGIREILIVTGRNKKSIEDFFDYTPELDAVLEETKQREFLDLSKKMENMADIYFVRQKHPIGFADAVLYAKPFTGDEPFAVMLGDDIIYTEKGCRPGIRQLADAYEQTGKTTVAMMRVDDADVSKYANVKGHALSERLFAIEQIVEKPRVEDKFSNDAVIGRYVVDATIYDMIAQTPVSSKGEIYFTDSLGLLAREGNLLGYRFEGVRYDAGNKLDFLKANIEFALRDPALGEELRAYLKELSGKIS